MLSICHHPHDYSNLYISQRPLAHKAHNKSSLLIVEFSNCSLFCFCCFFVSFCARATHRLQPCLYSTADCRLSGEPSPRLCLDRNRVDLCAPGSPRGLFTLPSTLSRPSGCKSGDAVSVFRPTEPATALCVPLSLLPFLFSRLVLAICAQEGKGIRAQDGQHQTISASDVHGCCSDPFLKKKKKDTTTGSTTTSVATQTLLYRHAQTALKLHRLVSVASTRAAIIY